MGKKIIENVGKSADISGHEDLVRISPTELRIRMENATWVIKSVTPIEVIDKDRSEDDYP